MKVKQFAPVLGVSLAVAARPFIKWAGGKNQLLTELLKHIPMPPQIGYGKGIGHYYEPFIGGGALYFRLRALGFKGRATLGDSNERLVRTYMGVRNDVQAVIDGLKEHTYNKKEYLYERSRDVDSASWDDADVAIWFIYLNRTGFNGLYRVNSKGQFNVPFGAYDNPLICDEANLRACSEALRGTKLVMGDFIKTVKSAERGDLVYFDSPYAPVNTTSNFTGYTLDGFTLEDQERLHDCALSLKARGVHVILSNADVPIVRKLYKGKEFTVRAVSARRAINSKAASRGAVGEVIII